MYCVFIPEYEGDHCFVPVSSCFATCNYLNRVGKIVSFELDNEIEEEKTIFILLILKENNCRPFYNYTKME